MACAPNIAKLLSHIRACQTAKLPGARLELWGHGRQFGYVAPALAARLAAVSGDVTVAGGRVTLARAALPQLNVLAEAAGIALRGEDFDVRETAEAKAFAVLDRGALPAFGVIGVGVHLNGLVRRADGWHLWVARRAADKKLDPGKLDHLVAGGVPAGLTPRQALTKEAAEEAGLDEDMVAAARQVGRFAYAMERPEGLRRDVIFAYDLVLPEDFAPRPVDGEVEGFELWALDAVFERAASTDDFKFNVNLVLIDLFIRYGLVAGEDAALLRLALQGEGA